MPACLILKALCVRLTQAAQLQDNPVTLDTIQPSDGGEAANAQPLAGPARLPNCCSISSACTS